MATPPMMPTSEKRGFTLKLAVPSSKKKFINLESMFSEEDIKKIHDKINTEKQMEIPRTDIQFILRNELSHLHRLFSDMNNRNVEDLYQEIEKEQTQHNHIEFTIYMSPISERLIANITSLIWNGEELLHGENIMLYKSTGLSRGTGLEDYWLPYIGERYKSVAKLEDKYVLILDLLINNRAEFNDEQKEILKDIIINMFTYKKYMRFINKIYLIASFLLYLNSDEYMVTHSHDPYMREYTVDEKRNASSYLLEKGINIQYIKITREIIPDMIKPQPLPPPPPPMP